MAGNIEHVINTACYPVITVFVTTRTVTAKVHIFKRGEIGLLETFMVTKQCTRLTRPRIGDDQIAFACSFLRNAFVVYQSRLNTEERPRCRTRFQLSGTRQRGYHETAGFGLPPGIDNRALAVTNSPVVPLPGFRVNRFAN
ncbi:hypothetical protein SRABI106_04077 [Rahnella aquatilis]|nr:hypothetical protein SRABI106_04077 [Rahnella aquatilis]